MKTLKTPNTNKQKTRNNRLIKALKSRLPYLIPLTIGLLLIAISLITKIPKKAETKQTTFNVKSASMSGQAREIVLDLQGEIANPGVYKVNDDIRLGEVIQKAGGLTEKADLDWAQKNLNLASKVYDGLKIYIPAKGQTGSIPIPLLTGNGTQAQELQININNASKAVLDTLPGIGEVTAQKIIDNRPYQTIEELQTRRIVKPSVFENIKDKISIF